MEGKARAAHDNGNLPIVLGDAMATQKPELQAAAYERIDNFFTVVISADNFERLLSQPA
ncbi:isochorismatase family protein [Microvirga sp. KLBC 81]|uniref:isochorismatase family protein n=1 Tax=Microvirga sp. KLBC 81 TaxID=1862707 RepID=UPI00210FD0D6|nr:isochorismatase family protein [Microvirga sp. KLBC 81]